MSSEHREDVGQGRDVKRLIFAAGGGLALVALGALALESGWVPQWISGRVPAPEIAESEFF